MKTEIDYDDIPELDDTFWSTAQIISQPTKKPITIRIDDDVLSFFKSTSPKYQTTINTVLRSYVEAQKTKQVAKV